MKNVVITAANSFIGRRLCRALSKKEYFIYAVVRETFNKQEIFGEIENLQLVYCNMENYGRLGSLINKKCEIGVALAWNGTRGADRADDRKQEKNFICSMKCLKSFIQLGCNTVMTAGSQAEYGPWNRAEKITESAICNPNTEYGKAKLKLYNSAKLYCAKHNVRLLEPRFFSLYGDDDFEGTMIITMIRNMLSNRTCNLTECVQLWDFLYIDDAIRALIMLIETKEVEGIYNIGSGISKPLKEYIEKMYEITKSNSLLNYGAIEYPITGIVHTNPSIEKLRKDINWDTSISFQEGIEKVIRYQKEVLDEQNKYSSPCCREEENDGSK